MTRDEKIFNGIPFIDRVDDYFNMPKTQILSAMQQNAIAFAEWLRVKGYAEIYSKKDDMFLWVNEINGKGITTTELYKLFNETT